MKLNLFLLLMALLASLLVVVAEDIHIEEEEEVFEEEEEIIEEEEEEEEWDGVLRENDNLVTTVKFVDYEAQALPLGKEITMLVKIANNGNEFLNISAIGASIHSPYDFNYHIQNFSYKVLAEELRPRLEYTLEFTFKPDVKLEPLEYWLSCGVILNGTNRFFKQVPYNGTITLTNADMSIGAHDVFTYLLSMGLLGAGTYGIFLFLSSKKKKRATPSQSASNASAADLGWQTTGHTQKAAKKVRNRRNL